MDILLDCKRSRFSGILKYTSVDRENIKYTWSTPRDISGLGDFCALAAVGGRYIRDRRGRARGVGGTGTREDGEV